jgi:HK97 family phage major capsid protein
VNIKALQQKYSAKLAEAQGLSDKADATEADATKATAAIAECKALKSQIEAAQAAAADLEALKRWDNDPANALPQPAGEPSGSKQANFAGKTYVDLVTGEVTEGGKGIPTDSQVKALISPEYVKAFGAFLRAGGEMGRVKSADARKFLSEGIDVDGGQTVPAQVMAGIISKDPTPTRVLDYIRTITVSSDRAQWLRNVYNTDNFYSSAVRVYPTGEGQAATVTDKPQFGLLTINVHSFTAELSISRELLEDTAFDIISFVTGEFRTAYRNYCAQKVISGTGVGQHFGILTRAGQANIGPDIVKSGDANLVTWSGLRKIKNAVPEQYDMNCRYMFNKVSTQDAIEALVDDNLRPLWPEQQRSGLESGTPGTLQGYSYIREAFMPDVAANALPYLFGDLMGYIRALRIGMTMETLREIEARKGQVVFLCRFRDGGDVAEPWRLKVGKIAA